MPNPQQPTDDDEPTAGSEVLARHPHLWPWVGWYALVVDGMVAGVFPDAAAAVLAVAQVVGSPTSVHVARIGGDSAVPLPPADGGPPRPPATRP